MHHSFEEICQIEPRLLLLFKSIPTRILNPAPQYVDSFWGNWSGIKADMTRLVGWFGESPQLGSHVDYETTYRALFDEANTHCPEQPEEDDE